MEQVSTIVACVFMRKTEIAEQTMRDPTSRAFNHGLTGNILFIYHLRRRKIKVRLCGEGGVCALLKTSSH